MTTVYVLAIDHEYGTDISVYSTEEKAQYSLYCFVKLWWDDVLDEEIPEDQEEAVNRYFAEQVGEESFLIASCVIDDAEGLDY